MTIELPGSNLQNKKWKEELKMRKPNRIILASSFLIIIALAAYFAFFSNKKQDQKKVSQFGKYQGYTEKIYDGYKRASDFLTLSDGTRLAYDVYLPTKKRVPASQPYPVLFLYTPLRTDTHPFQ